MEKAKEFSEKLIERISQKTKLGKKMIIPVFLLAAGVVGLLISELPALSETSSPELTTVALKTGEQDYVEQLEERLNLLISKIEGVGAVTVMVTLESSVEDVYLHNFDYGENIDSGGKSNIEQKDEYVIVDDGQAEKGIVVRVNQPRIRGVAVVCEGGGSDVIKTRITETVTALLDISSARVSVSEMG